MSYYKIINNKIIYNKSIIYSLNNIDNIIECFRISYKTNIVYPYKDKDIHNNNVIIAKHINPSITELITVTNICYSKQNYIYSIIYDNNTINISLLY